MGYLSKLQGGNEGFRNYSGVCHNLCFILLRHNIDILTGKDNGAQLSLLAV